MKKQPSYIFRVLKTSPVRDPVSSLTNIALAENPRANGDSRRDLYEFIPDLQLDPE